MTGAWQVVLFWLLVRAWSAHWLHLRPLQQRTLTAAAIRNCGSRRCVRCSVVLAAVGSSSGGGSGSTISNLKPKEGTTYMFSTERWISLGQRTTSWTSVALLTCSLRTRAQLLHTIVKMSLHLAEKKQRSLSRDKQSVQTQEQNKSS